QHAALPHPQLLHCPPGRLPAEVVSIRSSRRQTVAEPMSQNPTLRPTAPEDMPFLYRVYAGTREEELGPVPWTPAEKEAFLQSQFAAQHRHYTERYQDATFQI